MSRALERLLSDLPGNGERFVAAASAVSDWGAIFDEARRHGVLGVLCRALSASNVRPASTAIGSADADLRAQRDWMRKLDIGLRQVLRAFHRSRIRVAALKGSLFGERYYPEAWLRPATDIDLLIEPEDLSRASMTLEVMGYRQAPGSGVSRVYHHHVAFEHPHWPTVELHFRLFAGFGVVIPAKDFLARALVYTPKGGGPPVLVLCLEDELVYLSLHAASHRFIRLAWLYDLKLVLSRLSDSDEREIEDHAKRLGVFFPVMLTLAQVEERLGGRIPAWVAAYSKDLRTRVASLLIDDPFLRSRRSSTITETALNKIGSLAFSMLLCAGPDIAARWAARRVAHVVRREVARLIDGVPARGSRAER